MDTDIFRGEMKTIIQTYTRTIYQSSLIRIITKDQANKRGSRIGYYDSCLKLCKLCFDAVI